MIKYYSSNHISGIHLTVNEKYARVYYQNHFGIKSQRPLKVGDWVKIGHLNSDSYKVSSKRAKVVQVENGLPIRVKLQDGVVVEVFGLIMELLPLLLQIWLKIKDVFK